MNEVEVAQAMTYANQIDPRLQTNDATVEVWWAGLQTVPADAARWAIKQHYATSNANGEGAAVVNPAIIRRLITAELQQRESKQRALEPPKNKAPHPISFRKRDPERWDRLMEQGRQEHLADLQRRGIITQATLNEGGHSFAQNQENK